MTNLSRATPAPKQLTAGHKRVHEYITQTLYFPVEDEVQVGIYTLDMYVRELHVAIEYDGHLYHSTPKQKLHDETRDVWLKDTVGIPVLRIREMKTKKDQEQELLKILPFFESQVDDIDERINKARSYGFFV